MELLERMREYNRSARAFPPLHSYAKIEKGIHDKGMFTQHCTLAICLASYSLFA